MLVPTAFLALAATPALAATVGFNYGSTFANGAARVQADFEAEFTTAQQLVSAPQVFSSARLYTMVQAGTANTPIEAIPAAIKTKTTLLLGMWASAGDTNFANELAALRSAIATYGSDLAPLVVGLSVGSEDLYRITPTGISNGEYSGAQPDTITGYIAQVRDAVAGTPLASIPIGHVDTWTAWVNSSNNGVVAACDFIGTDAYPYFETTLSNTISASQALFNSALEQTKAAVGSKPVWVTETGWPVSGPTKNLAEASIENAKAYWDAVGCSLFESTNTWWYTLQDATPNTAAASFGIVGSSLTTTPLYDLSCNSSSSSSSTPTTPTTSDADPLTSNIVIDSNSTTGTVSSATPAATGGSGSGSQGSGPGSGPGGSGPNSTLTTGAASPSATTVSTSGASGQHDLVSFSAAFVALLAATL